MDKIPEETPLIHYYKNTGRNLADILLTTFGGTKENQPCIPELKKKRPLHTELKKKCPVRKGIRI